MLAYSGIFFSSGEIYECDVFSHLQSVTSISVNPFDSRRLKSQLLYIDTIQTFTNKDTFDDPTPKQLYKPCERIKQKRN